MSPAASPAEQTWPGVISAALRGEDLGRDAAGWAMGQIMRGEATPSQIAGLVVALRAKGESPAELAGLVEAMVAHAVPVSVPRDAVDTCGTGGDRAHTVNISTMAAIVAAGAGAPVAKHGNRSASSSSGSADVLEALGVVVDLGPEEASRCLEQVGITFFFAPRYHPALRHAAAARRELGVATVFNVIGPLANPGRPAAQAVGVADERMAGVMAQVLAGRGVSALVFRGEDGLDELTPSGPSQVWVVRAGEVEHTRLDPRALGVDEAPVGALRGGDAAHNAAVVHAVLGGERGAVRDAVLLNTAAALVALDGTSDGRGASEVAESLPELLGAALRRGEESLDSGAAAAALERWVAVSQQLAGG